DENLYVGYENFDDNMSDMVISEVQNGWWAGTSNDSAETHISDGDGGTTYAYFTNPEAAGFVFRSGPSHITEANYEASAKMLEDKWNAIQVIPFADIGVNSATKRDLAALFVRNYHGSENFTWQGGYVWSAADQNMIHLVE